MRKIARSVLCMRMSALKSSKSITFALKPGDDSDDDSDDDDDDDDNDDV